MKKILRAFFGLAGFGLLALAFTPFTENRAAASGSAPMTVINVPLPVQGTVSVGNTPSVNVANTPNVNIANSAVPVNGSVSVANAVDSANNPVPLAVTPGLPYQDICSILHSGNQCNFTSTPAGMRLVIQEFDNLATQLPGEHAYYAVVATQISNASDIQEHFFPLTSLGTVPGVGSQFAAHQPTTLYASPSSTPQCVVAADADTDLSAFCQISGYLVPAQ